MMIDRKYQLLTSIYLAAFKAVVQGPVVKHSASAGVLPLLYLVSPEKKGIFSIALDRGASQVRRH